MTKQYYAIDLVKFLLAILLVCAHASTECLHLPIYLDIWFSFYIIAVPFFLTTSAYFFFKKVKETPDNLRLSLYKRYSRRILSLYLIWSIIYTVFKIANWTISGQLSLNIFLEHLYNSIVYSSYPTIWFLPSLWVAVSITFLLLYRIRVKFSFVFLLSLILYTIGYIFSVVPCSQNSLSIFVETYLKYFISFRNGIFNSFIFVVIGAFIARKNICESSSHSTRYYFYLVCLFTLCFVLEAFAIKLWVNNKTDANWLFMLIPFTYYFVVFISKVELKPRPSFIWFRNMSLLIFVSQRLFITAIPKLFGMTEWIYNQYIGLFVYVFSTLLFSYLIIKLSAKFKFLHILWK